MVDTPNNSELFSPFLPTTSNIPEEQDRLKTFLYDQFANYADVINDKVIGNFTQDAETQNGKKFAYDTTKQTRNGYQAMARIKSFITTSIPLPIEDVNPEFVISLVYGSASKPCSSIGAGDGRYFSFFGTGNADIQFVMTDTKINITASPAMAAYSGFIIIEYIRAGT